MSSSAASPVVGGPDIPRRGRAALTPLLVVLGVLAALIAGGLTVASGGQHYAALGLPDAGSFTEDGLAVLAVATELGAVVCVGSLLLAAFLVPPRRSGALAADGYAAVRTAGWAALFWCVAALLSVPFTVADALGRPVYQLTPATTWSLVTELDQPRAWLVTVVITLLVSVGCWLALSWGAAIGLFLGGLLGVAPLAVTGHSSAGGAHDLATDSLLYHLFGVALWVGGLIALLAHARRGGPWLGVATRRFSALALVCWLVMAASGVLNALVRLPVRDLLDTAYGLMVLAKMIALVTLGVVGYLQRRHTVRAVLATGSRRSLFRLTGVELLIMFATIGISAALSRTAPPTDNVARPTVTATQIGYDLAGPPTLGRLLFDWRFELIFGTAAIVLAAGYLLGVRRLRRRGEPWSTGRTVSWLAGCLLVLLATSSGIGRYAPAVFSVHLASQLLLSVLAPALLVLGAPFALALRALPATGADEPPGPRDWLLTLAGSPLASALTRPVVGLVLFVGASYVLYLTGLFDAALNDHWAHLAMTLYFLLAGCLFYWPLLGTRSARSRWIPLVAAAIALTVLGLVLVNWQTPIGWAFYHSLGQPWLTEPLADQRLAGRLAIAFSAVPLVLAILVRRSPGEPSPKAGSPGVRLGTTAGV